MRAQHKILFELTPHFSKMTWRLRNSPENTDGQTPGQTQIEI